MLFNDMLGQGGIFNEAAQRRPVFKADFRDFHGIGSQARRLVVTVINVAGCDKLYIEVAAGEPEVFRPIFCRDDAEISGAELAYGSLEAAGSVVIGCDGQRPTTEDLIVLFKKLCGCFGGLKGRISFVDPVVDGHVEAAGPRHKLPNPRLWRISHLTIGLQFRCTTKSTVGICCWLTL